MKGHHIVVIIIQIWVQLNKYPGIIMNIIGTY